MFAAIGFDGLYTEPHKYARVQGLDIEFGLFAAQVGAPQLVAEMTDGVVSASSKVQIENAGSSARRFKVEHFSASDREPLRSQSLFFAAGQTRTIKLGRVSLKVRPDNSAVYNVTKTGPVTRLIVSDAVSGWRCRTCDTRGRSGCSTSMWSNRTWPNPAEKWRSF